MNRLKRDRYLLKRYLKEISSIYLYSSQSYKKYVYYMNLFIEISYMIRRILAEESNSPIIQFKNFYKMEISLLKDEQSQTK
jgi:hypothetical protein